MRYILMRGFLEEKIIKDNHEMHSFTWVQFQ